MITPIRFCVCSERSELIASRRISEKIIKKQLLLSGSNCFLITNDIYGGSMRRISLLCFLVLFFAVAMSAQEGQDQNQGQNVSAPRGTPYSIVAYIFHEDGETPHKTISVKFKDEEVLAPGQGPYYLNWEGEEDTALGSRYLPEYGYLQIQLGVLTYKAPGHHIHVWLIGDDGTEYETVVEMDDKDFIRIDDIMIGKKPYKIKDNPTQKYGE